MQAPALPGSEFQAAARTAVSDTRASDRRSAPGAGCRLAVTSTRTVSSPAPATRHTDVHSVSPHLAALNAPIVAAGGFVTTIGAAPPDCGVFERSRERGRLYREGVFRPTTGLVIWPRADMLRWWRSYTVAVA